MPKHDFECAVCGVTSEALVGAEEYRIGCPLCGHGGARRVYGRAPASTIFKPRYVQALGKKVNSRRELEAELQAMGAAEKGSTERRRESPPSVPSIMDAASRLTRSEVLAQRDKRERREYELRNGR